jgi:hypothetical protein
MLLTGNAQRARPNVACPRSTCARAESAAGWLTRNSHFIAQSADTSTGHAMADLAIDNVRISLGTDATVVPIRRSSRPDSISQLDFAQESIDEKHLSSDQIRHSAFFDVAGEQME